MSNQEVADAVQEMYSILPEGTRSAFNSDSEQAHLYYADFVEFVGRVVPTSPQRKAALLDIGCGCSWSSFAFASNDFRVTGVDLNAEAFEPPPHPDLTLLEASPPFSAL